MSTNIFSRIFHLQVVIRSETSKDRLAAYDEYSNCCGTSSAGDVGRNVHGLPSGAYGDCSGWYGTSPFTDLGRNVHGWSSHAYWTVWDVPGCGSGTKRPRIAKPCTSIVLAGKGHPRLLIWGETSADRQAAIFLADTGNPRLLIRGRDMCHPHPPGILYLLPSVHPACSVGTARCAFIEESK